MYIVCYIDYILNGLMTDEGSGELSDGFIVGGYIEA